MKHYFAWEFTSKHSLQDMKHLSLVAVNALEEQGQEITNCSITAGHGMWLLNIMYREKPPQSQKLTFWERVQILFTGKLSTHE